MTSSNGNIFHVTGLLYGELTGHRWIPCTKASNAKLWCFLLSAPEQSVEQTIVRLVIWDAPVWFETPFFLFSLISAWTNDWANNRDAGKLRCYNAHYDVAVMRKRYLSHRLSWIPSWQTSLRNCIFINQVRKMGLGTLAVFGLFPWNKEKYHGINAGISLGLRTTLSYNLLQKQCMIVTFASNTDILCLCVCV